MLPNFLIGGVQRGGTTSMFEVLRRHPQIFMGQGARSKELHFFSDDYQYSLGLERYSRYFDGCDGQSAVGEASPSYIYVEHALDRIVRGLPGVKLIFVLRNPVERAYSDYWFYRRNLRESQPFHKAVHREGNVYVGRGLYYDQLSRFAHRFPLENLLVLLADDMSKDPVAFYQTCFRFLGVDSEFTCPEMTRKFNESAIPANRAYRFFLQHPSAMGCFPGKRVKGKVRSLLNKGKQVPYSYTPMEPETRRVLVERFAGPNRQLAEFLGRNLAHWDR